MPDANINQYHPASGRVLKETNELVNVADLLQMAFGLPYAALNSQAGIFSCEITADAGETCALNIFFDNKTVLSKVILPENNITPITSEGLATGTYGDILTASGLNLVDGFSDNSQAQIVNNASVSGNAVGGNGIDNALITDGSNPINISFTNNTGAEISQKLVVKFFDLDNVQVLNLLQSGTQLESNTEMSQYGAN